MIATLVAAVLGAGHIVAVAPPVTADNPQPLEGDLVLPLPAGREIVFRPVALGLEGQPYAVREFTMGDRKAVAQRERLTKTQLGGSFLAPTGNGHDVVFYIAKYEVTEAQYAAVTDPAALAKATAQPRVNVSKRDTDVFTDTLNSWLLKNAPAQLPHRDGSPGFMRLPTEAEWEFSARGGVVVVPEVFEQQCYWTGRAAEYEWFAGPTSSFDKLKGVGILKPNQLGIFDMLGNAAELTDTRYSLGGHEGGWTVRGGNFRTNEGELRASARMELPVHDATGKPSSSDDVGFRLVIAAQVVTTQNARTVGAPPSVFLSPIEEARNLFAQAMAADAKQDPKEALQLLAEAEKRNPLAAEVLLNKARLLDETNQHELAMPVWTKLVEPSVPEEYRVVAQTVLDSYKRGAENTKREEDLARQLHEAQVNLDRAHQEMEAQSIKAAEVEARAQKATEAEIQARKLAEAYAHQIPATNAASGGTVSDAGAGVARNGKPPTGADPASIGTWPGERFPQTRLRIMDVSDAQQLSHDDLRYAINEAYARHGGTFPKLPALERHLHAYPWYHPRSGVSADEIELDFSEIETANVKLMGDVRNGTVQAASTSIAPPPAGVRLSAPETNLSLPGEHYSFTRQKQVEQSDISGLNDAQLRYAINEMYARHGFIFADKEINHHFAQLGWYHPRRGMSMDELENEFTPLEHANMQQLGAERDARKGGPTVATRQFAVQKPRPQAPIYQPRTVVQTPQVYQAPPPQPQPVFVMPRSTGVQLQLNMGDLVRQLTMPMIVPNNSGQPRQFRYNSPRRPAPVSTNYHHSHAR